MLFFIRICLFFLSTSIFAQTLIVQNLRTNRIKELHVGDMIGLITNLDTLEICYYWPDSTPGRGYWREKGMWKLTHIDTSRKVVELVNQVTMNSHQFLISNVKFFLYQSLSFRALKQELVIMGFGTTAVGIMGALAYHDKGSMAVLGSGLTVVSYFWFTRPRPNDDHFKFIGFKE